MRQTPHSTNRLFEWASAVIMLQMGGGVMLAIIFEVKIAGVFTVLTDWGLSSAQIGLLFMVAGFGGCFALYANGHWQRYGCYMRAGRCAVGVLIWSQMFFGVLLMLINNNQLVMVLFVWLTMTVFEMISLSRAFMDCSNYRITIGGGENAPLTS